MVLLLLTTGILELKEMNKNKIGGPFSYPNTYSSFTLDMPKYTFIFNTDKPMKELQGHAHRKVLSIHDLQSN